MSIFSAVNCPFVHEIAPNGVAQPVCIVPVLVVHEYSMIHCLQTVQGQLSTLTLLLARKVFNICGGQSNPELRDVFKVQRY